MTPTRLALLALSAALLSGCGDSASSEKKTTPPEASVTKPSDIVISVPAKADTVVVATTEGEMTFELFRDKAPNTVDNFEKLAKAGFYNGTAFHRIMKGFMIQGGDPKTKDLTLRAEWGTGGPGYTIKDEFNDTHHGRGVISMAHTTAPDSAGSQFFICDSNAGFLDGKYAAFGKIVKGDDVLEKILSTPVTMSASGENSSPTKRVEIKSITVAPAAK